MLGALGKNFILLCAVISACATAAPRPRLIEPRQVIQAPDYLQASAAAGDAVVAVSDIGIPGNDSQVIVQANLCVRDAGGVYQLQGVLFSETADDPIDAVAMSATVIALGVQNLRLEVVGTKLRVYVNDVLLLERSDTTFTRGSSGFITYNTAASYDDYIAYQP